MCGRFDLHLPQELLAEIFGISVGRDIQPRYNITPSQEVLVIRRGREDREMSFLHWGLIPSWAKDASIGHKTINARSETAHEKPAFKHALRHHRCLIPANGFYEWFTDGARKKPFYIHLKKDIPFAFAGLWDHWKSPAGEVIESCTILTTEANTLLKRIHDRMPVILDPRDYNIWLNPSIYEIQSLKYLFEPLPADKMEMYPVSDLVNSPRNDTPECIKPLET